MACLQLPSEHSYILTLPAVNSTVAYGALMWGCRVGFLIQDLRYSVPLASIFLLKVFVLLAIFLGCKLLTLVNQVLEIRDNEARVIRSKRDRFSELQVADYT